MANYPQQILMKIEEISIPDAETFLPKNFVYEIESEIWAGLGLLGPVGQFKNHELTVLFITILSSI